MIQHNTAAERSCHWRVLWWGGSHFPLAALLVIYVLIDLLLPSALQLARHRTASPINYSMTFEDPVGGTYALPSLDTKPPAWILAIYVTTICSAFAQRVVFAVWVASGPGWWLARFCVALASAAFLYALTQLQLSASVESWKDVAAPLAALPLELLSLAAPPAALALWSGRRLRHEQAGTALPQRNSQFSIADILLLTGVIGASISLAGWKDMRTNQQAVVPIPASVMWTVLALGLSTVYSLPVTWVTLAIRSRVRAVAVLAGLTAALAAILLVTAPQQDWQIAVGGAGGLLLTVPGSLLLWRCAGYRLLPSLLSDPAEPRTDAEPEMSQAKRRL